MLIEPARCQAIFGQVTDAARALGVADVEAILAAGSSALTRFANNAIHQNVAERSGHLSLRVQIDQRTARATTNRLDDASIRQVVEETIALTKLQEPDPALLPLAEPTAATECATRWDESTALVNPTGRAEAVADAIRIVESAGQTAAGIYSTSEGVFALLNSRGVIAYYPETMAQFSITAMAADSSGWAKGSACSHRDLDPAAMARTASEKAQASRNPVELPPGAYTVILEPAAVLDLAGQMFGDFSATAISDGRSFLRDRIGEKLFGENITIYDDAYHPLQAGSPFDGEGVPRRKLVLVDRGVVHEVAFCRQAAHTAGVEPTGHGFPLPNEFGEAPMNIVIAGGTAPIEEMIASTARGILVTRLWYIREVDPYEKIMTGMTRDGTFLIEDGRIARGVRNFRFNQALPEMLSNVEALSPAVRASGEESFDMVVPAMKVRGFHFTEVTRF
ncbi:MAG TPA: TldD/PmbA family protein [Bryobacteraceae bacterium]|jgi:predicted Zn-dependent protease|nr:TldD/PmbA family protein [Bryobacteraceae bacterium]